MSAIRVIATIVLPSGDFADEVASSMNEVNQRRQKEPGCIQYELFRSLDDPRKIALHELWESKAAYDEHWVSQCAKDGMPDPERLKRAKVEFYQYEVFDCIEGIWQPENPEDRISTIRWP